MGFKDKRLRRAFKLGYAYTMGINLGLIIHSNQGYNIAMDAKGKWITVGGEEDDTGAKHMYINPYSGEILKGPKVMQGKTLKEGFKDLKELNQKKQAQKQKKEAQKSAAQTTQKNAVQAAAKAAQKAEPAKGAEPQIKGSVKLTYQQVAAIKYKEKSMYSASSGSKQAKGKQSAASTSKPANAQGALNTGDSFSPHKSIDDTIKSFSTVMEAQRKSFTESNRDAIFWYSGNGYKEMNSSLRGFKKGDTISQEVADLTDALNKCTLPENTVLHRGGSIKELQSYLNMPLLDLHGASQEMLDSFKGSKFFVKQFLSTSIDETSSFPGDMRMTIKAPKGTKGCYLDKGPGQEGLSKFIGEKEVLLQRGLSFTISNLSRKNGKIYVEIIANDDKPKLVEKMKKGELNAQQYER